VTSIEPTPPDPERDLTRLRVSDADRHQVAEVLREAAGDGRIDLAELDERLEATFAAKTYADLVPITLDLPTHASQSPAVPTSSASAVPAERHAAIMGGFERKGVWVVPPELHVLAVMGGADIDLRSATFSAAEVVIIVNVVMGGAQITVNPQTNVIMEGTGIMGGYSGPSGSQPARLTPGSPTVRVRGVAIMGGVSVERREVR
jgi:hypothetical protein